MKVEKIDAFFQDALKSMKSRQEKMMSTYGFREKENKYIMFPEKNKFFLFNENTGKVFFEAKFQIIGTYVDKSKTWRWAWSNRYVPAELKKTALRIMDFGKANNIEILSRPKIKDENMGYLFTSLGMKLSNAKGYYIIPSSRTYPDIFLIFTQVKKVNHLYDDVVSQLKEEKKNKTKKLRKIMSLKNKSQSKRKISIKNKK